MLAKDHHVIANVNAVMAALHGVCILLMISGSIYQRELAFSQLCEADNSYTSTTSRGRSSRKAVDGSAINDKTASRFLSVKLNSTDLLEGVGATRGSGRERRQLSCGLGLLVNTLRRYFKPNKHTG